MKILELVGQIGKWGISMDYVKYMLADLGSGPITVKLTSFGGEVSHALKIKEMFETHGNVTVEYIGFNASAATIIGHGAAKTRIREDAFYLIHKPSVWVDAWGEMNEDKLQEAIDDLIAQKKDAEVFTLSIAQDYVNNRGLDLKTVLDLMKESRWLSAQEAVELNLVDELIPIKKKQKIDISNEIVASMKAMNLPLPNLEDGNKDSEKKSQLASLDDSDKENIIQQLKNIFSPKNKTTMNKKFTLINALMKVDGFEEKDGNISLSTEQLQLVNDRLQRLADSAKKGTTAINDLSLVITKLDELDESIKNAEGVEAKVNAIKAILASRPSVSPENPQGSSSEPTDLSNNVDWDVIDNLPHNIEVDKEII